MKPLLIGCSVVFLLGIVGVVLAGFLFFGNVKDFVEDFEESGDRFTQLEKDFPFQPPEGWAIDPARFEVYLACRQGVFDLVEQAESDLDQEPGWKKPVRSLSIFPDVIHQTAQVLTRNEMSLTEYRWYDLEVVLVVEKSSLEEELREQVVPRGELAEADSTAEKSEMGSKEDRFWREVRDAFDLEEFDGGGASVSWKMEQNQGLDLDEMRIDARRVLIPEVNTELVRQYRDQLLETAKVTRLTRMFNL